MMMLPDECSAVKQGRSRIYERYDRKGHGRDEAEFAALVL
jgi:hypothetical protein